MTRTLTPEMALDPAAVVGCYRGALALEDEADRLAASYALLLTGRLGLRPGELLHCHEGWIDWERGDLHVPERDPCACRLCWERARVAQRDGDARPLAAIVAAEQWAGTARTIPVGWSPRLTSAIATALDAWDYLDRSAEDLRTLMVASAEETAAIDDVATVEPESVSVGALRAAAATFFADVGFDAPRLAAVMGLSLDAATAFSAQDPGRARTHLYETFDVDPPAAPDARADYPLVGDADRLPGEPFDPAAYDADWRIDRAAVADPPRSSPRPGIVPEGVDAAGIDLPVETAGATPATQPAGASGDASAGDAGGAAARSTATAPDPAVDEDGLADLVTPPVALVVQTRFACPSMERGRACGGRVLIGQGELVLAAHGGGEITAVRTLPFDGIRDVAIDWAPDHLAGVFGPTVGLAVERDGERENVVVELPQDDRPAFTRALFRGLLDAVTAVARHPATVDGRVTDAEQRRCVVRLGEDGLELAPSPGEEPEGTVAFADVTGVERDASTLDASVAQAITVEHLTAAGSVAQTAIAPLGDRERTLLYRFLLAECREREREAQAASLADRSQTVLDALQSTTGQRDLGTLLDMDRATLDDLVASLAADGFVSDTEDGVRLTGLGHRCARERPDLDA